MWSGTGYDVGKRHEQGKTKGGAKALIGWEIDRAYRDSYVTGTIVRARRYAPGGRSV